MSATNQSSACRRWSRRVGTLAFTFALICCASVAQAQVTSNPHAVTFLASADHDAIGSDGQPIVTRYDLEFVQVGAGQPFLVLNLGKPAPGADRYITVDFWSMLAAPPMPGHVLEAHVAAVGPAGKGDSTPSNQFTFDAIGSTDTTAPVAPLGRQRGDRQSLGVAVLRSGANVVQSGANVPRLTAGDAAGNTSTDTLTVTYTPTVTYPLTVTHTAGPLGRERGDRDRERAYGDCAPTMHQVLAAPPSQPGDPVQAMWQSTGVMVHAGDVVTIGAATGATWRSGDRVLTADGDAADVVSGLNCPVAGQPRMALVGRIGLNGQPFRIGSLAQFTALQDGDLYVAPDDDWYLLWDNSGSLAISICVMEPAPAPAEPCTGVSATVPTRAGVATPASFAATPTPAGCAGTVTYDWTYGDGTAHGIQAVTTNSYATANTYGWSLTAQVGGSAVVKTGSIAVTAGVWSNTTVVAAPTLQPAVDPVQSMWQNTGVMVHTGDLVTVSVAAGSAWQKGDQVLTADGDARDVVNAPTCPMRGQPRLALVGRIGPTGAPFRIGSQTQFVATKTDLLYLAPNDDWYLLWDNSGNLAVSVGTAPPSPVPCNGVATTVPTTAGQANPVTFTATPTPAGCVGTVTYDWNFGDGSADATQAVTAHAYLALNTYPWTLTAQVGRSAVVKTGSVVVTDGVISDTTVAAAPVAQPGVDPVQSMWQSTGVTVHAGDLVTISVAAGSTWQSGGLDLTADGDARTMVDGPNCPMPGQPHLALVARIGPTGAPFRVGSQMQFVATQNDLLYLAPNDKWYLLWNNSGNLTVTVLVRK